MKVGVIGLGRMGAPMARRILDGGHAVTAFDVDAVALAAVADGGALAAVADGGATAAGSPAEVADGADVVLTSLPGPAEVERVMSGDGGLLAAAGTETVIVETSTIGPGQCRSLARAFAGNGVAFLDAPISGGVQGARDGTLTVMVGGDAAAFGRALPVLECIGSHVRHMGESGAGSLAKLVNQMVFLTTTAVLCEGVALAEAHGMEPGPLLDVLSTSVAAAPMGSGWHDRLRTGDTEGGFHVYRVLKDLHLVRDACTEAGFAAPSFAAALADYERAAERGFAQRDLSVLRDVLLDRGGKA